MSTCLGTDVHLSSGAPSMFQYFLVCPGLLFAVHPRCKPLARVKDGPKMGVDSEHGACCLSAIAGCIRLVHVALVMLVRAGYPCCMRMSMTRAACISLMHQQLGLPATPPTWQLQPALHLGQRLTTWQMYCNKTHEPSALSCCGGSRSTWYRQPQGRASEPSRSSR